MTNIEDLKKKILKVKDEIHSAEADTSGGGIMQEVEDIFKNFDSDSKDGGANKLEKQSEVNKEPSEPDNFRDSEDLQQILEDNKTVRTVRKQEQVGQKLSNMPEIGPLWEQYQDHAVWARDMPATYTEEFLTYVQPVFFGPQDVLFEMSRRTPRLFFVCSGRLGCYKEDNNGKIKKLYEIKDGSFVGEQAIMDGANHFADVKALEETFCLMLSEKNFNALKNEKPRVANTLLLQVGKGLSLRFRKALGQVTNFIENEF